MNTMEKLASLTNSSLSLKHCEMEAHQANKMCEGSIVWELLSQRAGTLVGIAGKRRVFHAVIWKQLGWIHHESEISSKKKSMILPSDGSTEPENNLIDYEINYNNILI